MMTISNNKVETLVSGMQEVFSEMKRNQEVQMRDLEKKVQQRAQDYQPEGLGKHFNRLV